MEIIKEYALVHRLYCNSANSAKVKEGSISTFSFAGQDC